MDTRRQVGMLKCLGGAKSRRPRKEEANGVSGGRRLVAAILFVVLVFAWPEVCWCLRQQPEQTSQQQQQQQQQAQQQALEQSPMSQASYGQAAVLADSSGISSLLPGEELAFTNLGQPLYSAKRARKMSAFMPMRGRKDGRDSEPRVWFDASGALEEPLASILAQQQQQQQQFQQPFREADGSDLKLVKLLAPIGGEQWSPRQFANQLAAAHRQSLLLAEQAASGTQLDGQPAEFMQAKLRRAFHPMRGKKFDPEMSFIAPLMADELQ